MPQEHVEALFLQQLRSLRSANSIDARSLSGIELHGVQLAPFGLFFSQNPRLGSPSSRIFAQKQPQNWLRWTWQSIPDRLLVAILFSYFINIYRW